MCDFSSKKWTFGSPTTSMNVHGFQPNSNRVTLTMSSSYPVNMSKIWEVKKYHLLCCFHWQSLRGVTFGVIYNYHECPWISTKFDVKQSHCTLIHPCEYEQNLRNSKISPLYLEKKFSHEKLLSTIFTQCAQNISKIITRMDYPTLWDIDYTHTDSLNEPIFMLPAHRPSK